jgi:hypothetical protein
MENIDITAEEDISYKDAWEKLSSFPDTSSFTTNKYRYKILFTDRDGTLLSTYDETWENAGITAEILDNTEIFFVKRIVRVLNRK